MSYLFFLQVKLNTSLSTGTTKSPIANSLKIKPLFWCWSIWQQPSTTGIQILDLIADKHHVIVVDLLVSCELSQGKVAPTIPGMYEQTLTL